MDPILFAWVDLIINAIEPIALAAVLWQLFHLRRDIMAMLRVLSPNLNRVSCIVLTMIVHGSS
jgi:hypothetical protein